MKTIEVGTSSEDINEVLREALLMNQLQHDRVCHLVGICPASTQEPMKLILQYCEFGSLDGVLRSYDFPPLNFSAQYLMASDVGSGLSYIHAEGVVHRDIASRNVLVDSMFRCRICDFGHAGIKIDGAFAAKKPGRVAIRWIAPEALKTDEYTECSDVWSFGVLLHEIWTCASLPYLGWDNTRVVKEVIEGIYKLPCPENCPERVYTIMRSCWEQRLHRPTFNELCFSFDALLAKGDQFAIHAVMSKSSDSSPRPRSIQSWVSSQFLRSRSTQSWVSSQSLRSGVHEASESSVGKADSNSFTTKKKIADDALGTPNGQIRRGGRKGYEYSDSSSLLTVHTSAARSADAIDNGNIELTVIAPVVQRASLLSAVTEGEMSVAVESTVVFESVV